MTRLLLGIRRERGESLVERAPPRADGPRGDPGREQRVRETQSLTVELEDTRLQRILNAAHWVVHCELDKLDRRVGRGSDDTAHLVCVGAQRLEPLDHEVLERRRHRELGSRLDPRAAPLQRACQLEREERIAARRLPDPE
jgi:hypothetical protein